MVDDALEKGLLPEGLRDALPPEAGHADAIRRNLLDCFVSHGYEQVKPPLIEFEQSLVGRFEAESRLDMFRLLDPESQRMMVLRSDITGQIARMAATRLGHYPRPLRLSYEGTALRVKGSQLRPERQFGQAGVELIGPDSREAALEIVLLAQDALTTLDVQDISLDLVFPRFVPTLCAEIKLNEEEIGQVRDALDHMDMAALTILDDQTRTYFETILKSVGPAEDALAVLENVNFPPKTNALKVEIKNFVEVLKTATSDLPLSVDLVERRGFSYQGDFGFSLFSACSQVELGRGGRYGIRAQNDAVEPATGFTLYVDSLCKVVPMKANDKKIYLPFLTPREVGASLRQDGWITIPALEPIEDLHCEAQRLGCSHIWKDGCAVPLTI